MDSTKGNDAGRQQQHDCEPGDLQFVAHYAAPGIGQAWECVRCGRSWSLVGRRFYRPDERAHELRPEDVR